MWPNEPADLVRNITRGEIRPILQWYGGEGGHGKPSQHAKAGRAQSPPRSPPHKGSAGKHKRPGRPPSAPLLSNPASKLTRPQSSSGLQRAPPSASLLGQALPPKRAPTKARMPVSATQAELQRKLNRTPSGGALPPRRLADEMLYNIASDGPVVLGGPGGAAASHAAAHRKAMRHAASQQVLASPYNQHITSAVSKRAGSAGARDGGGSGGGFRSEALQLEVKLAEGLQALQVAEQASGGGAHGGARGSKPRLQLFRTLWEKVIERDAMLETPAEEGGPKAACRPSHVKHIKQRPGPP